MTTSTSSRISLNTDQAADLVFEQGALAGTVDLVVAGHRLGSFRVGGLAAALAAGDAVAYKSGRGPQLPLQPINDPRRFMLLRDQGTMTAITVTGPSGQQRRFRVHVAELAELVDFLPPVPRVMTAHLTDDDHFVRRDALDRLQQVLGGPAFSDPDLALRSFEGSTAAYSVCTRPGFFTQEPAVYEERATACFELAEGLSDIDAEHRLRRTFELEDWAHGLSIDRVSFSRPDYATLD